MNKMCWAEKSTFKPQSPKSTKYRLGLDFRARDGYIRFSLFWQSIQSDRIFREISVLAALSIIIRHVLVLDATRSEAGDANLVDKIAL